MIERGIVAAGVLAATENIGITKFEGKASMSFQGSQPIITIGNQSIMFAIYQRPFVEEMVNRWNKFENEKDE